MTDRSTDAAELVEVWRGDILESTHRGHAVICRADGQVVAEWGAPDAIIYPRSSCKMLQALPLVESGAADAAGLGGEELALSCASHQGALLHTERVADWLAGLGLGRGICAAARNSPATRPRRSGCAGQARAHVSFTTIVRASMRAS